MATTIPLVCCICGRQFGSVEVTYEVPTNAVSHGLCGWVCAQRWESGDFVPGRVVSARGDGE